MRELLTYLKDKIEMMVLMLVGSSKVFVQKLVTRTRFIFNFERGWRVGDLRSVGCVPFIFKLSGWTYVRHVWRVRRMRWGIWPTCKRLQRNTEVFKVKIDHVPWRKLWVLRISGAYNVYQTGGIHGKLYQTAFAGQRVQIPREYDSHRETPDAELRPLQWNNPKPAVK